MPDTATPEFPTEGVGPQPGKWWGESLTIWGVLLTALTTVAPSILSALGLDVPVELLERLGHDTVSVVQAIGGLAGTVIAILGRVRATAPLARRAMAVRV